MKYILIVLMLSMGFSAFCKTLQSEAEFKNISNEISEVTKNLQKAWDTKNEVELYSFNIEKKTSPLAEKMLSFMDRNPEYKDSFQDKISVLNNLIDKINNQHAKELPQAKEEAIAALEKAEAAVAKSQSKVNKNGAEFVSYEEWFTLQKTGIKSGKKYSFIACVNGVRNATATRCHISGSEAKRIFYNTDDIKNLDTKKKWVNTVNQVQCVTAYVTGQEAFVVDIKDQNECK